jgi:PiT family inorganic phosphate transporter
MTYTHLTQAERYQIEILRKAKHTQSDIVGAVMGKAGSSALVSSGILKIVAFIFISPVLGFFWGLLMLLAVAWICRRATLSKVDRWFRRLQLVSAGTYSLGHGGNDAQKTIGLIWMLLIATGYSASTNTAPPTWARLCAATPRLRPGSVCRFLNH